MRGFVDDVYETTGQTSFSMAIVDEARRAVGQLVGAPPECLSFIKNTSEGLNIAASGLGLGEGDEVLITDLEHSANVLPWRYLESRGVAVAMVRARDGRLPVEAFVEKMNERTRVVALSWVSYGNGYRVDLPALGRECRERNVLLVVDGIQGVGVLAMPLPELGADVLACGAHKGLLALAGTGFLYCRKEVIPRITPTHAARFSFAIDDKWHRPLRLADDARRFDYGNPNFLGLAVLKRSSEFLMEIGLTAIEARIRELTTRLIEAADAAGARLATPRPWSERAGIVSFDLPDAAATAERALQDRILVAVKDGRTLRTAVHFYNTEEEVDRLVEHLART